MRPFPWRWCRGGEPEKEKAKVECGAEKRLPYLMVLRYFMPGFLLIFTLSALMIVKIKESEERRIKNDFRSQTLNGARIVQSNLAVAPSALRVSMLLATQRLAAYDGPMPPPFNLTRDVQLDAMNWMRLWPMYKQVRYVSASGAELAKACAEWDGNELEWLGPASSYYLEPDLRGTYEYQTAMNLSRDQVFVDKARCSGFDPGNRESMLLAYTAVFPQDLSSVETANNIDLSAEPLGYISIAMRAARVVDALSVVMDGDSGVGYVFLNTDGEYIAGSLSVEETVRATNYSFAEAHPDLWESVSSSENTDTVGPVTVHMDKGGLVSYVTISPCSFLDNPYVVLASCVTTGRYYLVVMASATEVTARQEWSVWPLLMSFLSMLLWLGVAVSFTRSNCATEELLRKTVTMEQFRSRNKELFLATMCHELRSPLNVIVGAVSLMEGPDLPEDKLSILKLMEGSAEMLMAIINDVLDISKIEAGHMELDLQPCALRQSLEACIDVHASIAQRKGLNMHINFGASVPESCVVDFPKLRQVVSNILSNANKFTTTGGVEVFVRTLPGPPLGSFRPLPVSAAEAGSKPMSGDVCSSGKRETSPGCLKSRLQALQAAVRGCVTGCGFVSSEEQQAPQQTRRRGSGTRRTGRAPTPALLKEAALKELETSHNDVEWGSEGHAGRLDDEESSETLSRQGFDTGAQMIETVWLEIAVTDTGKGIAEERQAKMFDAYTQEDIGSTRQYGGTGLGLAISKRLVELWGGTITLMSVVDKGTTFKVTVPVGVSSSQSRQQRGPQHQSGGALDVALPMPGQEGPVTLAMVHGMCAANTEALEAAAGQAGVQVRRFPTYEQLVKATALQAVGMGRNASLIGEPGGAISAVVIDSELVDAGLPRMVEAMREAHPNFGIVVLLGSRWASRLGQNELPDCFVISMPVTAAKVEAVLLQIAGGATSSAAASEVGSMGTFSTNSSLSISAFSSVHGVDAVYSPMSGRQRSGGAELPTCKSGRQAPSFGEAASGGVVQPWTAVTAAPQLRALVVDDVAANRRVLQRMLELQGVLADVAADGAEAVAMEREASPPYDLIYMDLHMPGMDGVEATQAIRERHAAAAQERAAGAAPAKRTRMIMLTASALSSDRDRCLAAGVDSFLSKPVTKQRIKDSIIERAIGAGPA